MHGELDGGEQTLYPWRAKHVLDAFHIFSYLIIIMQTNEVSSSFLHMGKVIVKEVL